MGFIGAVETFDNLFVMAEVSRFLIEVLETDDLVVGKRRKRTSIGIDKMDSRRISRIAIGN